MLGEIPRLAADRHRVLGVGASRRSLERARNNAQDACPRLEGAEKAICAPAGLAQIFGSEPKCIIVCIGYVTSPLTNITDPFHGDYAT